MSDWWPLGILMLLAFIAYRLERIQEHVRAIDAKLTRREKDTHW
jgi:hypothetical protein